MRIKSPVVGGIIFVVGMIAISIFRYHISLTYVNQDAAVAFGRRYFLELKENGTKVAFAMYTNGFLEKCGEEWEKVVSNLNTNYGTVADYQVLESHVAPATLHNLTVVPCVIVQYRVTRRHLISVEKLTICPGQRSEDWGIAGHEITIADTGQHFEAGLTMRERAAPESK
jgi:hypothetical protein